MCKKVNFWLVLKDEFYEPTSQTGSVEGGLAGLLTGVLLTSPPRLVPQFYYHLV